MTAAEADLEADEEGTTLELEVDGDTVRLSLPANADESEAAAIASAVGAHLHDRAVAAARAADDSGDTGRDRADPWTLAGRMKAVNRRRWPKDVDRGEEWKAAARSF